MPDDYTLHSAFLFSDCSGDMEVHRETTVAHVTFETCPRSAIEVDEKVESACTQAKAAGVRLARLYCKTADGFVKDIDRVVCGACDAARSLEVEKINGATDATGSMLSAALAGVAGLLFIIAAVKTIGMAVNYVRAQSKRDDTPPSSVTDTEAREQSSLRRRHRQQH
jgi:hypothetical protein